MYTVSSAYISSRCANPIVKTFSIDESLVYASQILVQIFRASIDALNACYISKLLWSWRHRHYVNLFISNEVCDVSVFLVFFVCWTHGVHICCVVLLRLKVYNNNNKKWNNIVNANNATIAISQHPSNMKTVVCAIISGRNKVSFFNSLRIRWLAPIATSHTILDSWLLLLLFFLARCNWVSENVNLLKSSFGMYACCFFTQIKNYLWLLRYDTVFFVDCRKSEKKTHTHTLGKRWEFDWIWWMRKWATENPLKLYMRESEVVFEIQVGKKECDRITTVNLW